MVENRRYGNRIKDYDYSESGWYFVTMCIFGKKVWFGEIVDEKMVLNEYGETVRDQWLWMGEHFEYVELDEWVIMPNHFHGIVVIDRDKLKINSEKDNIHTIPGRDNPRIVPTKGTEIYNRRHNLLSKCINAFKTTSSKKIHQNGLQEFRWHRSFFDHIIRNEKSLHKIRRYIQNNPLSWSIDRENPKNIRKTNEPS